MHTLNKGPKDRQPYLTNNNNQVYLDQYYKGSKKHGKCHHKVIAGRQILAIKKPTGTNKIQRKNLNAMAVF